MSRRFLAFVIRLLTGVRQVEMPAERVNVRVFFANHTSHLDFVVIWASLPAPLRERTHPVAAADYWSANRLRRWLALKVFRAILIPRGKITREDDPIGKMAGVLEQGDHLILFPEGTRSLDGNIGEFHAGLHALTKRCPQAELIPVYLENLNHILPKGEFLLVPLMGSTTFGPPCAGPQPQEGRHNFLNRARSAVLALADP